MRLWMWNNAQLCINIDTIATIKKQTIRTYPNTDSEEFVVWTTDSRGTTLNKEEYESLMEFIQRGGIR